MFKTIFSEHNKIWGQLPPNAPPCLRTWADPSRESLPLGAFIFVQGARHSEILFLIHNIHVMAFADCANNIINIFPQIPTIGS